MLRGSVSVFRVASAEAARRFYCERLGFQERFAYRQDDSSADPCYRGLERDGAALHVSSFSGDGVFGSVAHFVVDDVDALHDEFRAKGVAIDLPPTDQTWEVREMHLTDPDGNRLRFGMEQDPVTSGRIAPATTVGD